MGRRERQNAPAAYTLVDISELPDEIRDDIIEDANAGGGQYGIRVVEESVNGGARAPIYGYYRDGEDAERWTKAKKKFNLSAAEVDDGDVVGAGVDITDPRREAAIREGAAQRAEQQADRIRAGEDAEVEAITGDKLGVRAGADSATDGHAQNIVDTTLDPNSTNEAADAENQEAAKASKGKTTKTPR